MNLIVLGALKRLAFIYTLPCLCVMVVYTRENFCLLARKIFSEILKVNGVDKQIGK